jgi:hypothetical protein
MLIVETHMTSRVMHENWGVPKIRASEKSTQEKYYHNSIYEL